MEYDFLRNTITGTAFARFSMDHEALGFWLSEELGDNAEKYVDICQQIALLQSSQLSEWRLIGKALSIELDNEQVRVFANNIAEGEDDEAEMDESMSFYDGESEAFCGLEDFYAVLVNWRKFLDEQ
ncbi:YacL family protein [Shewanella sp. KX20019]|uniref:YacL family protein n=1 Tax=Shewanella sp. KX20019 TaxID=2803864 RepID=UPI0019293853|nr:YacL family protein [Shewanella sp. KX20019]QQX79319.1 YacL family protein [Shewanella sp. KX20019]